MLTFTFAPMDEGNFRRADGQLVLVHVSSRDYRSKVREVCFNILCALCVPFKISRLRKIKDEFEDDLVRQLSQSLR